MCIRDSIYGGENDFDLFDIKGEVEMFLYKLNLENFALFYYYNETTDGTKIDIRINEELICNIFKADMQWRNEFEIEKEVYIAEFYLNKVLPKVNNIRHFKAISKFPSVKRDIAVIVDSKINYDKLKSSIEKSGGELLKNFKLFDVYEDKKIGENKKSYAFSLEFSSNEKTLTDDETTKIVNRITENLEKSLGATFRK